jgi:phage-related protein
MVETKTGPLAQPQEVPFNEAGVGCLFLGLVPATSLFAFAAFDMQFFERLAESPVRRNWLGIVRPFQWGGVNVAVLALVLYTLFELQRLARRFVDTRAVWIEGDTIRFHPTLRRRALPLAEVEAVIHEVGEIKSILWVKPKGGRRIKVAMVDKEAARVFVDEVERARANLTFG